MLFVFFPVVITLGHRHIHEDSTASALPNSYDRIKNYELPNPFQVLSLFNFFSFPRVLKLLFFIDIT